MSCPSCGDSFVIDESGYAQILQQVRNEEFERELNIRSAELKRLSDAEFETRMNAEYEKRKEIELYRDFKTKLSTKMIGETLEHHSNEVDVEKNYCNFPSRGFFEGNDESAAETMDDFLPCVAFDCNENPHYLWR